MTREVITADTSSTIFDVMKLMVAKNVGGVILTEGGAAVGIFTEQDVLKRVMNTRLDPKKTGIKRVMTSPIRAVRQDTHIIEALGKMYRSKFRHLLVWGEKGAIAGMVSMRAILRLAVESGQGLTETRTIGSIMSREIVKVDDSKSIYEAIDTMIKRESGCVIVFGAGTPKGIFTERDVLKRVAVKNIDTKKSPVTEVMTANLVTAPQSALISEVLSQMYKGDFRNMPIRGEGENLVGMVSLGDVLQYARALDVDEKVRKTWKEIEEFWESEEHYTPG